MLKNIAKTLAIGLCAAALITALPFQAMAKPKNLSKNVKVGDIVYFGRYEQDGDEDNGKEKIEWQVLSKKGNKALLISKKVLDTRSYHQAEEYITWEKCSLRTWLNKDFIKEAFSSKEGKKLQKSKIENKDNKVKGGEYSWHTKGGKNTTDKVFLLSIDEAKKYFKTDKKRTAKITKYAKVGDYSENNNWEYWLRSPGDDQGHAACVGEDGWVNCGGRYVALDADDGGVRPAIWVNL